MKTWELTYLLYVIGILLLFISKYIKRFIGSLVFVLLDYVILMICISFLQIIRLKR
jgi:hypothetical protein